MKTIVALVLAGFVLTAGALKAEDPAPAKPAPEKLTIPGGDPIDVVAPEGWKLTKIQPKPTLPPTIILHSANNDTELRVTFIADKAGAFNTQDKIEKALTQAAQQYVTGSVEKKLTLQDLKSANGKSSFAEFTDADLVGKQPGPGQYKVVGTGLLVVGNTAAIITLLGNALDDKSYVAGKAFLKSGITPHK